ncbi:MAG: DNA primase [Sphaerochaetaceae bacterium]
MAKYSESVIEEIKSKLSIVEIVSNYLTLNRKGDRFWGLCPFHNEKTPSFSVLPDRGFYHCFGCGKSGSMFDFIMEMEHLTFPESVKYLAEKCGISIEEETPADKIRRTEIETLRDLYAKISASFHYILFESSSADNARNYLAGRKISVEMQKKFYLGYAPDDPDWLYRFLSSKHYSDAILAKSGLFGKNNPRYPLFRNRVIFPIRDWQGHCVAFGGRDLSGESQAKYINTPETVLYRKREIVYGMYESLPALKKESSCILCEGYFDVIAMHQAGMTTAMAPLGTAFTTEQGKLVRRYAGKAYTLFDSDNAGQAATKKALVTCESLGMENHVILLEGAKDPAEIVEKQGNEALSNACKQSRSGFDHLVHSALNMYDIKKPKGKLSVFNEVKPYLDAVDSEIVKQGYMRILADFLQSDEATLLKEYQTGTGGRPSVVTRDNRKVQDSSVDTSLNAWKRSVDLYALLTLMNNRELFPTYRGKLHIGDLVNEQAVELYAVLEDATREGIGAADEVILDMIQDNRLKQLVAMSFQTKEFKIQPEDILNESVYRVSIRKLESERKHVENLIRLAETDGTVAIDLSNLLLEKKSLDEEIAKMRKPEHV